MSLPGYVGIYDRCAETVYGKFREGRVPPLPAWSMLTIDERALWWVVRKFEQEHQSDFDMLDAKAVELATQIAIDNRSRG